MDHLLRVCPEIVVRHIVGTCHNDHHSRMKVYDIRLETHQHVRRGLSTDTPSEIVVFGKKLGMVIGPILSDGITHKHHLGICLVGNNTLVVSFVVYEAKPIL